MTFQPDTSAIVWRLHLVSPPPRIFEMLTTDAGRAAFWAESAVERTGVIHFVFPNGTEWQAPILQMAAPLQFAVEYYGGSQATFDLHDDGRGGTDLILTDQGVAATDRAEVTAGWVSVLMALKAAVDFGIDLRGHDPARTWDQGYVEN